jgi:hypothetical protein
MTVTDLDALQQAARGTWTVARQFVFPGEGGILVRDLPKLAVEGPSFRVEFRLQDDLLGRTSDSPERTMVMLRFAAASHPMPDDPWCVNVRGHWPDRVRFGTVGLFSARRLRKAFSPKRRTPAEVDDKLPTNEDVYLMPDTPEEDLTAQLCLFVLQTNLSAEEAVADWFLRYLSRFRSRVRDRRDRQEVARDVLPTLLRNKWWPEDARAWRKLLKTTIRFAERAHYRLDSGNPPDIADSAPNPEEELLQERAESTRVRFRNPGSSNTTREPFEPTANFFTVEEASHRIGISRSALYARIDRREVQIEILSGRRVIAKSEVERLAKAPRTRTVVEVVAKARHCSESAARRYISRQKQRGRTLDEVMREHSHPGSLNR